MSGAQQDEETLLGGKDYQSKELFDPKEVLDWYEGIGDDTPAKLFSSRMMGHLHNTMQSGKFKGDRLGEFCSGPSIHGIMSASKYFKQVYLMEYTPHCREFLQRWLEQDTEVHDWGPYLQHVAQLEATGVTPEQITQRIKKCIKAILPCDLTQLPPVEEHRLQEMLPLDCILSSLTLEVAADDRPSYAKIISNLASYLRPGGGLLLIGMLNQSFYFVGSSKYTTLKLDAEFVRDTVEKSGFDIVEQEVYFMNEKWMEPNPISDCFQYCFLSAIKK